MGFGCLFHVVVTVRLELKREWYFVCGVWCWVHVVMVNYEVKVKERMVFCMWGLVLDSCGCGYEAVRLKLKRKWNFICGIWCLSHVVVVMRSELKSEWYFVCGSSRWLVMFIRTIMLVFYRLSVPSLQRIS